VPGLPGGTGPPDQPHSFEQKFDYRLARPLDERLRPIDIGARQATSEEIDTERTIRLVALDPQPWDAGAVATILPELADQ
jgi:hypothetical protein